MSVQAVMISHPGRQKTRTRSLASLAAVGIVPVVIEQPAHWTLTRANHTRTSQRALAWALDRDPSHVLFLEDDIAAAPSLPCWLANPPAGPATLYASGDTFYGAALRRAFAAGAPLPRGWVPVRGVRRWYGSVALLLPAATARALVRSQVGARHGFDIVLASYLLAAREPFFVAVPNPIQHVGWPSTLGSHRLWSVTYDG